MQALHKIKIFTDRYPLLGPGVWIFAIQYFIVQMVVARSWKPPYSWRFDTISDLGNSACGTFNGRAVCSSLHVLMDISFVVLGALMTAGSLLIYQEFRKNRGTLVGFSMMALAGLGTILVGLFPENVSSTLHVAGATMPFLVGNVALVVLSFALQRVNVLLRAYTFVSGFVALVALGFLVGHHYGKLGDGGVERIVAYPQTVWLIIFGLYMSRNHVRYIRIFMSKLKAFLLY